MHERRLRTSNPRIIATAGVLSASAAILAVPVPIEVMAMARAGGADGW